MREGSILTILLGQFDWIGLSLTSGSDFSIPVRKQQQRAVVSMCERQTNRLTRLSMVFGVCLLCLGSLPLENKCSAQRFPDDFFGGNGNGNPFDPQQMMKAMFGPPTEEEAKALEGIEISVRDERRYGSDLVDNYLKAKRESGVRFTDRGPKVEYIQSLIDKLRPQMANASRYRRIKVYIVEIDEPDALSFPGGTLLFTSGLLEFCRNEAALLGVIGHELSHLDRGHQLLPLKRSKLAEQTFRGQQGFDPRRMMQTFSVLSETWTRPFRPEDELQADVDGATWAFFAGYDPRELAKLFLQLDETRERPSAGKPAFLVTHPFDEDRFRNIMDRYEKLRDAEPDLELTIGAESHQEKLRSFR